MQCILKDYEDVLATGTVVCQVKDPSGNISTETVSTPATGTYHAFYTVDEDGTWYYHFESSGATIGAGEDSFMVNPSQFP